MAIHEKQFKEELYLEHIEEAAFLYTTRLEWLHDDDVGWQELAETEDRIEAHLDALVIGESIALKVCLDLLDEAEADVLHVIVRVFCRHRLIDRFARLWKDFDFEDAEKIAAVSDALKWECPDEWMPSIHKVFSSAKKEMFPLLASCLAYRSPQSGELLVSSIESSEEKDLVEMLWAISRSEHKNRQTVISSLASYINNDDATLVYQAALTLMNLGEMRTLSQCFKRVNELPLLFAVGGNSRSCLPLLEQAQKGLAEEDTILALGLNGDLSAVPSLLNYLEHPDYAKTAVLALHLISGASLYEDVHAADEVEEDELFEHEIDAFRSGELPKNIDGKPFGVEVKQLSLEKERWFNWFQENKAQFNKGVRYRNGSPYGLRPLLNGLYDNSTPHKIRSFIYEELRIRYSLNIPFSADELIGRQQAQLNKIYQWSEKSMGLFPEGQWLFAGKPI